MTSFLKYKEKESGYGGDWAVRIEAQSDKSVSLPFVILAFWNTVYLYSGYEVVTTDKKFSKMMLFDFLIGC